LLLLLTYLHRPGVKVLIAACRRTFACSLTLPTFQVAEDFTLSSATASFSLWLTVPLLVAEHFWLLALRCGTACQWR